MNAEHERDLHELLCAWLLGEADEDERARVEAALERSPELRAERDRLAATIALVREAVPSGEMLGAASAERLAAAAQSATPSASQSAAHSGAHSGAPSAVQPAAQLGAPSSADSGAAPARRSWLRLVMGSPALRVAASVAVLAAGYAAWRGTLDDAAPAGREDRLAQVEESRAERESGAAQAEPSTRAKDLAAQDFAAQGAPAESGNAAATDARRHAERKLGAEERALEDALAGEARDDADANALDLGAELLARTESLAAGEVRKEQGDAGDRPEGASVGGYADPRAAGAVGQDRARASELDVSVDSVTAVTGGRLADAPVESEARVLRLEAAGRSRGLADAERLTVDESASARDAYRPGGGGGGPSGPAGPTTPGPASGSAGSPGAPAPHRGPGDTVPPGGPAAGESLALGQPVSKRRAPAPPGSAAEPSTEAPGSGEKGEKVVLGRRLQELGYVDGEAGLGADGFFLGTGASTGASTVPLSSDPCAAGVDVALVRSLAPEAREEWLREQTRRLVDCCRQRPGETPQAMFFRFWGDNPFEVAALDPLSTFAVDVDTASYALARRTLTEGRLPAKAQIRTEEFVNYFRPDVPPPLDGTFRVQTELAPSRFGEPGADLWMLRVGLRGREVSRAERMPLSLTFVVDVSGSMRRDGRLALVQHALRRLVAEMDANDALAIVAFSKEARLVLPMTSAANRGAAEAAIAGLVPDGGTNAEAGLVLGYEEARRSVSEHRSDRVVFLSDGVANVGQTDQDRINEQVAEARAAGVYLNTVGVGMGDHNDVFLEQLANKGDGICNYVDSEAEVQRALVGNFTGAFEPIARDVKIQVELDPRSVRRYRLLGYENRAIADADFRNDAVDAGEVGAGHQVVALYELELAAPAPEAPVATVRVRWLPPAGDRATAEATEIAHPVSVASATSFEGAGTGYRRSVLVAQLAEVLRRSRHARGDSLDELVAEARELARERTDPDWLEAVTLIERTRELLATEGTAPDELRTALEAVRTSSWRAALAEREGGEAAAAEAERQREQMETLEAWIQDLLRERVEGRREDADGR